MRGAHILWMALQTPTFDFAIQDALRYMANHPELPVDSEIKLEFGELTSKQRRLMRLACTHLSNIRAARQKAKFDETKATTKNSVEELNEVRNGKFRWHCNGEAGK